MTEMLKLVDLLKGIFGETGAFLIVVIYLIRRWFFRDLQRDIVVYLKLMGARNRIYSNIEIQLKKIAQALSPSDD
jgi:hypothetical protein